MKPSDFKKFPFSSVLQNTESEIVAMNIMVILRRTGDAFRPLSWGEYKTERMKDGHYTDTEKGCFDSVIKYLKSADTAILFSKSWETAGAKS